MIDLCISDDETSASPTAAEHHPLYPCPFCDKAFRRAFNTRRHVQYHCKALKAMQLQRGHGSRDQPPPSPSSPGSHSSSSYLQSGGGDSNSPSHSDSFNSFNLNGSSDSGSSVGEPSDLPGDLAPEGFEEVETSFRGRLKTYRLVQMSPEHVTIPEFLVALFDKIVQLMHRILSYVTSIKMNLWLDCEFTNIHGQTCRRAFKTKNISIFRSTDIDDVCGDMFQKLIDEKEACEMKGSGWTFLRVMDMEIRVNVYRPLGGSSYIPLPPSIALRKAVINVHNAADHKCFQYAILSKFIDPKTVNTSRLSPADFTQNIHNRAKLDFSDLTYPVRMEQIPAFEKKNGVSINVYGLDYVRSSKTGHQSQPRYEHIVYPLRTTDEEEDQPDHFDLLLLTDDEKTHYALITNFERLVRSQITRRDHRIYVCKRCFAHFDDQPTKLGLTGAERLQEHRRYCKDHAALRVDLAEKEKIRFDRFERRQRVRFTIYADFECALEPYVDGQQLDPSPTVTPPDRDPAADRGLPHHHHRRQGVAAFDSPHVSTRKVHKPYAYAYYIQDNHTSDRLSLPVNNDDNTVFSVVRMYRGRDAAAHFMKTLKDDVQHIGDVLYGNRQMNAQLSAAEEASFQAADICYICSRPFTNGGGEDDNHIKVRDHQHSPPYRYRGAAHRLCNLQFKEQTMVNCYFHNLSNYDAHFVVRELGIDKGDVSVLANSEEKYISFSKYFKYQGAGRHNKLGVRFLDSYRFLARGLAHLAKLLPEDKFSITKSYFPDQDQFQAVKRKGVFPYEYVTSLDVLNETVLPPMEAFRDSLRKEDVSHDDYAHAQHVWNAFQCATLGDYADIYLQTDVLLLADIFEGFRDMCLTHYGLDPAHYLTLPSYAWDVMLFKTGVTLDTLQDADQYLFFEKGIRGGLAQCVTRHAVVQNKYTRSAPRRCCRGESSSSGKNSSDCDHSRDGRFAPQHQQNVGVNNTGDNDEYIMYYDANNLYGWAMSQPLPTGNFKWLSRDEIDGLDIMNIPTDGNIGYVMEVDLEYPRDKNLHDEHRQLPFCPEVRKAPIEQLPYPPDVLKNFSVGKSPKLMVTLLDKDEYVIHYRLLQQALHNGLRIRHIHRVLKFQQSAWLKPYVAMNTELRRNAKNKFEVELFKLMVNAVYGMSLQNVRKHINIKLATNTTTYTKYVAKSNFVDRTWYNKDLALLHMSKVRVVLDKPVYAGMCILDHSKWWMYEFHYKMQRRYGADKLQLLYGDTDSFIYKIRTADVYNDMLEHLDDFDTSNYPQDHKCYNDMNARVLGKFKDEAGGAIIKEFIGLMAKLYCFVFHNGGGSDDNEAEEEDGPPPVKRAKGVNRAVVERDLTVEDYRRCLQEQAVKYTENERFQSRHHIIYTVMVGKRSLAPYDDKRYIIADGHGGVNTLPWGHYGIPIPLPPAEQQEQH